jgi:SSS family solute:Na+ symporter
MQNGILLGFILGYMAITVLIGWWAGRRVKTAADFAVAGKRLPMFMAACALFATWFGSETVMGASSRFVEEGVPGIIEDPFGASLCLLLAGLLVARPLYKLNLLTFSDFYRVRFNKTTEVVSALFMVPSYFSWIAAQLVALAILMQTVSGLDRSLGVILCTSMVLLYTYIGGMWSVAITDFVQTIVIIIGLTVLAVIVVSEAGGVNMMIAAAPANQPDFFRFFPRSNPISYIEWIAAWMTIGLGSIPQQDVFQRVMGARSEKASIRACYTSAVMYLTVAFIPLVIAYAGSILHPDLLDGDHQDLIPNMVLRHHGLLVQILFFGALMSAILSTASGAMLAPATVIGENLIKKIYRKELTDKQLLQTMRYSLIGVAVVTGTMALMRNDISELVGESSAFSLVSLFVPLIAGLYWKKANTTGAIAAMITGFTVWLITIWLIPAPTEPSLPEHSAWTEILLHVPPMIWGLVASFVGMVAGTYWERKGPYREVIL